MLVEIKVKIDNSETILKRNVPKVSIEELSEMFFTALKANGTIEEIEEEYIPMVGQTNDIN